ncbi:hypothetical protein P7L78_00490 (plasmid) [Tistrella bauzanensis]|jgi:hypothetical protein|uniref:Secreted protein n=1 Tax=Tistrella arctica TaxID=3133430 RepID=A0ABU9YKV2_9PROT
MPIKPRAVMITAAAAGPAVLALMLAATAPAAAQDATEETTPAPNAGPVQACPTRDALERSMDSPSGVVPEGCRAVTVNVLESRGERLCLIEFGEGDGGVLDALRDAATRSQWWVRCEALAAAAN